MQKNIILHGNSLEVLKSLEDNSVDCIVCDPPYELGFMGKSWDNSGIAYSVPLWSEALRVLKPGGYLLAFGGTRTYHRMAVAIEDAGFEIRDMIEWIYASGFPKSLNIGKNLDKKQGNEREDMGAHPNARETSGNIQICKKNGSGRLTKGSSPYEGFGTAIKPAHEPICMARKPLSEKTIVDNVLKHGTGGLNIDACRIPYTSDKDMASAEFGSQMDIKGGNLTTPNGVLNKNVEGNPQGRFPANILVSDDALNDGINTKSGKDCIRQKEGFFGEHGGLGDKGDIQTTYGDEGSKSRYFNIDIWAERNGILQFPKPAKAEKNNGCEELEQKQQDISRKEGNPGGSNPRNRGLLPRNNHHPTVKGLNLMSYLVSLVSKEGDIVLDPFAGSGTTLIAAFNLDRNYIGIELNEEYIKIAEARLNYYKEQKLNAPPKLF